MKKLILFFLLSANSILFSQSIHVIPSIEVVHAENMISLKAFANNNDETIHELNYLLLAIKRSESQNLSNQKQEGRFVIEPNEKINLSEVRLNISKGDEIKSYLFIWNDRDNYLVAKDSAYITFDGENLKVNMFLDLKKEIKKDDFVLRGLVVDQTKTKGGKDFFDLFYSKYNLLNEKYPFVAIINEIPSFGLSSFIQIEDAEKVLYTFRVAPGSDYLETQVEQTLRRLNQYNNELKFIKEQLLAP